MVNTQLKSLPVVVVLAVVTAQRVVTRPADRNLSMCRETWARASQNIYLEEHAAGRNRRHEMLIRNRARQHPSFSRVDLEALLSSREQPGRQRRRRVCVRVRSHKFHVEHKRFERNDNLGQHACAGIKEFLGSDVDAQVGRILRAITCLCTCQEEFGLIELLKTALTQVGYFTLS